MKRFFIAVAFLTAAVTAFADMVNLPKIKLAYVEENVQISPTGNVVEVSVSEKKSSGNTASDILSVPGKQFLWTPSELTSRATGGADIYCSLLSADGSALVICERIGGSGKPNGLRFIVLDTNSGKIIRASGIIKQKLHYAFMISNTEILAVVSSPGDRNEKMVLARIGIIDELVVPSDVIVSPECRFAASESRIYVYHPEEKNICVYSIDDFSPVAACNITNFSVNGITLSQDNSKLAVFGDGTVEIFNAEIHNNTLYSQEKYNVPNSCFSRCAAVSDNIFVFFAPESNAHVLLSRASTARRISDSGNSWSTRLFAKYCSKA